MIYFHHLLSISSSPWYGNPFLRNVWSMCHWMSLIHWSLHLFIQQWSAHFCKMSDCHFPKTLFVCLFVCFALSRATSTACGGSQARGPIEAVATGQRQSHSNVGSEPCLQTTPQLTATLDPLTHWARPGIQPATSWFLVRFVNHCTTSGTPIFLRLFVRWEGSAVRLITKSRTPENIWFGRILGNQVQ